LEKDGARARVWENSVDAARVWGKNVASMDILMSVGVSSSKLMGCVHCECDGGAC
jgi:hypothetical protein